MLRGVQLFHYTCAAVQLMIFSKQTNWGTAKFKHKRNCSSGKKMLQKIRIKYQIVNKSLAVVEYDVYIENYRLQETDKAFQIKTARPILAKFANITHTIKP